MSQITDCVNPYSVYMHILPNGKRYIGMTRQVPSKRWHGGLGYKGKKSFYEDIVFYGWENIQHIIVDSGLDLETASVKEQELIAKYHTQDKSFGYNTKSGGQTFGEHSDDFMDKLRSRMSGNKYCVGRKITQKHIEAMIKGRNAHGRKKIKGVFRHTEETKKLLSEKAKARWQDGEYRKRAMNTRPSMCGENNPMYGKKHSAEAKRKMALAATGRKASDETRKKLSEASTTKRRVIQYGKDRNIISIYESCKKAAEAVNGTSTNISFACRHTNRSYRGYRWGYANDNT